MKNLSLLSFLAFTLATPLAHAGFTAGNAVVLLCTNVSTGGGGVLVEYNQTGPTGFQVAMPTSGDSSIVFGNNSPLNHDISLSGDGALLIVGGFSNSITSVDTSSSASIPRVVATVKYDGTYARPFSSGTLLSTTSIRSVASDGFGNFWGNGNSGTYYFNVPTVVQSGATRVTAIFNGNIYFTTAAGLYALSGSPTNAAVGTQIILNTTMGTGASPASFALPPNPVTGSIAYLVDYNGANGIGHYHWNGSAWAFDYDLTLPSTKPQHIAVNYSGANPVLWVTPTAASANSLFFINDPGPAPGNATITSIATAPAGLVFRGIAMAPVQPAAPVFTAQPVGSTNSISDTVTFGPVSAIGANPNAFVWKKGNTILSNGASGTGSTISGSTSTTLTISGITAADAGTYTVVASNNGGSVTSTTAILALAGSAITTQLQSRTNVAGSTATFHVASSGAAPLSYAWTFNSSPLGDGSSPSGSGATISGSGTDTLTISGVQDADAGNYAVTVTDNNSTAAASAAALTVLDPPSINFAPVDQNKTLGGTAVFSVSAFGGSLSYKWLKGTLAVNNGATGTGSTITGATTTNLTIANVQSSDQAPYFVVITNLAGSTTAGPGNLVVGVPPAITTAISNSFAAVDSNATFTVAASGSSLSYIWKHESSVLTDDGFHIFGSTTPSLTVVGVQLSDARAYTVTATNAYGGASSTASLLVLLPPTPSSVVSNLIIYEPFNYPRGSYPAVVTYSWEGLVSIYNRVTGQPAYWYRDGGLNSAVQANDLSSNNRSGGNFPWPGIDCTGINMWYFSSAANNNHLKFGGVTNGSAYFSMIFHVDQGAALSGSYDVIGGFTSGDSVNGGANVDTWNYKLCVQDDAPGGDGYYLGVFKGGGATIGASSVNGQWCLNKHLARGQIHLLVGCYKIVTGGTTATDDVVSLWIDPDLSTFGASEANLPTPDAGGMTTNWGVNAAITEFGLRGSVVPASKRAAELRIGKTWASVTQPYYPQMKIVYDPANTTLTWPAKDFGYVLESNNDLSAPWTTISGPYNTDGTGLTNVVTFTPGDNTYFRLRYPIK